MTSTYEHDLQCAVAQWLDLKRWLWCAVPNGGHRRKAVAGKLKAEGVKRGVPDVLIFESHTINAGLSYAELRFGLALELKSPKGKPSKEQREWIAALKKRGWSVRVCKTIDEVIAACEVIQ